MNNNNNIDVIVKKLEALLGAEYGKCEIVDGTFRSGDESYHLYKISAINNSDSITIARDYMNGQYMAQFSCAEGNIDIFFGFGTKQKSTIRWRYYYPERDEYTQGYLADWFLMEQAAKTMTTLIVGTGVHEDGHEGHYFHTIVRK